MQEACKKAKKDPGQLPVETSGTPACANPNHQPHLPKHSQVMPVLYDLIYDKLWEPGNN